MRPLEQADLDELLAIQEEGSVLALAEIFPQDAYPFPRESIRDRWVEEIEDPGIHAWVAVEAGSLAGFAATRRDELLHFGTAVRTWGSGLASELHDAVIASLAEDYAVARLYVFEGNHRARRFYHKHGWSPTGSSTSSAFQPHPVLLEYQLKLG
jgi:RimJ/RimL family protein N-acetyltransferase